MNLGNILKIEKDMPFLVEINEAVDPSLQTIEKYSAHSRIFNIEKIINEMLPFGYVSSIKILNEINNMDTSKSLQSEGTPFKIIKDNAYILSNFTFQNFN